MEDPKQLAAEILGDMKAEKATAEKPAADTADDDVGLSASSALKDMFGAMQSGDFSAAASALKAAIAASED